MSLIEQYEKMLPSWLEKEGFGVTPLFAKHHDNTTTIASMAVPPHQLFEIAMVKFLSDLSIKEVIFSVDCFTKPGQGTKYDDVLNIFWWQGERTENFGFKFGVVNYRPPPNQIIEPIDWQNSFWQKQSLSVVEDFHRKTLRSLDEMARATPELVNDILTAVRERKELHQQGRKPS